MGLVFWVMIVGDSLSSQKLLKNFQDFPSHRILGHIHEALNIDKNKNELHSLSVNREKNFLTLVSL